MKIDDPLPRHPPKTSKLAFIIFGIIGAILGLLLIILVSFTAK
jgi:LPS O-antigen subunit length determinant protein (WzzB/FepE family)